MAETADRSHLHRYESFRVCRLCWVEHVENCPECFGFGFTEEGAIMRAGDAFDGSWGDGGFRVCEVCGGSPMGRVTGA